MVAAWVRCPSSDSSSIVVLHFSFLTTLTTLVADHMSMKGDSAGMILSSSVHQGTFGVLRVLCFGFPGFHNCSWAKEY